MSVTKLASFKIEFTGSNRHLYYNGNQQVSVTVTAQKIVDGNYVDLTPEEKNSIKVTERSENVNAPLPPGWHSDTEKNEYAEGAFSATSSVKERLDPIPINIDFIKADDNSPNVAIRYLRTTETASRQFMATIVVAGTTYSTNMPDFNQYISVSPSSPYQIQVSNLKLERDDAYNKEVSKGQHIDIDVYYWTLPSGLKVVRQSFSDYLNVFFSKHYPFYLSGSSPAICNSLIKPHVTSLDVNDFITQQSGNVRLYSAGIYIRGVRSRADGYVYASPGEKPYISTTITDTYGCVHSYRCYSENDHNTLKLTDA
ncbi:hypothetical protein POG22_11020 [Geitlerinema sp. CS-897]|nr:hypothetical protein [Geitlerinema sp. CS-897]